MRDTISHLSFVRKLKIGDQHMRVAIIVGHTKSSQGATSYTGESEYSWNTKVANFMKDEFDKLGVESKIFFRDGIGMSGVAREMAEDGNWDLSIELHFNAYSKVALGCEILIAEKGTDSNQDYAKCVYIADKITDDLANHFNLRERRSTAYPDDPNKIADGVKVTYDGVRGFGNLEVVHKRASVPVVLLIEPMFGNIEHSESRSIIPYPEKYARFLANNIAKHMGFEGEKPPTESDHTYTYTYEENDVKVTVEVNRKLNKNEVVRVVHNSGRSGETGPSGGFIHLAIPGEELN